MDAKECSNYRAIALISHAGKMMLKILQATLQQYVNQELQMYKLSLEKAGEPETKLPTPAGSQKKARELEKVYFCFIDYSKAFDCVDHNKLWKILKEMGIPKKPVCRTRRTVSTAHGTMDWFKFGKRALHGCILSPCLFNLYAESTMQNAGLDDLQAGIKFARRNINSLRYADGTTLMAESKEKVNSLLMRVKEENEKAGLKLNIQKTEIMASGPITLWQIDGEKWKQ